MDLNIPPCDLALQLPSANRCEVSKQPEKCSWVVRTLGDVRLMPDRQQVKARAHQRECAFHWEHARCSQSAEDSLAGARWRKPYSRLNPTCTRTTDVMNERNVAQVAGLWLHRRRMTKLVVTIGKYRASDHTKSSSVSAEYSPDRFSECHWCKHPKGCEFV